MEIDKIAIEEIESLRSERDCYKCLSDLLQEALQERDEELRLVKAQVRAIQNGQFVDYGVA